MSRREFKKVSRIEFKKVGAGCLRYIGPACQLCRGAAGAPESTAKCTSDPPTKPDRCPHNAFLVYAEQEPIAVPTSTPLPKIHQNTNTPFHRSQSPTALTGVYCVFCPLDLEAG